MTAWTFGLPLSPSCCLTSRGITTKVPEPVGSGWSIALNLAMGADSSAGPATDEFAAYA